MYITWKVFSPEEAFEVKLGLRSGLFSPAFVALILVISGQTSVFSYSSGWWHQHVRKDWSFAASQPGVLCIRQASKEEAVRTNRHANKSINLCQGCWKPTCFHETHPLFFLEGFFYVFLIWKGLISCRFATRNLSGFAKSLWLRPSWRPIWMFFQPGPSQQCDLLDPKTSTFI